jgi:hypothetical protein
METAARFCKHCGTAFGEDSAHFCKKCGAARPEPAEPPRQGASGAAAGVSGAAVLGRAAGVASRVASGSALAAALPWHTIRGREPIDVGAFLAAAAPGAARAVVSRSLKRPGLVLAFTIVIGVAVAVLTGGTSALVSALPQLLAGAVTSVLALVTGSKSGPLRTLTGVVSVVTALITLGSLGWTLYQSVAGDDSLLSLLPTALAVAASLVAAVKTSAVALRRS